MSKNIAVWSKDTIEYKRLELLKSLLNIIIAQEQLDLFLTIKNIYFDRGQDWIWTNLIVHENKSNDSYQLLYPSNHEKTIYGDIDDILEVANEIKNKWLKNKKEN